MQYVTKSMIPHEITFIIGRTRFLNKTFFGAHWLEVLELQQHGVVLWGHKLRRGTMYLGGDDAGVTLWFDLKVSLNSTSCCHYSCVSVAHIPTFLLLLNFSSTIHNTMLSILSKVRNESMLKSKFFKGFLVLLYKHQTHDSS